ncbi:hypothetical protein G9A89_008724 [Geosiphon pyriformis]|nr:hypothetical protein G9A89_008724 [Geosiphon pyriformis]
MSTIPQPTQPSQLEPTANITTLQNPSTETQLFGGACLANIPPHFMDVSDIREIPDNQEVFADPNTDQSIIVEILELVAEASDPASIVSFHFSSVAFDNDAENHSTLQQSGLLNPNDFPNLPSDTSMFFASGQQLVAKFNERDPNARNLVNIFLAVIRLPQHSTDIVITYNIPILIGSTSSSRLTAREGNVHVGFEEFKAFLKSFRIVDWGLFGS